MGSSLRGLFVVAFYDTMSGFATHTLCVGAAASFEGARRLFFSRQAFAGAQRAVDEAASVGLFVRAHVGRRRDASASAAAVSNLSPSERSTSTTVFTAMYR